MGHVIPGTGPVYKTIGYWVFLCGYIIVFCVGVGDVSEFIKRPWAATKLLFWALVIVLMLVKTPNYFRTVYVDGARGEWVLCESNTPGARAATASKIHR